jgi:hypothetical protein
MHIEKTKAEPSAVIDPASLMEGLIDSQGLAEALGVRPETLSRMAGDSSRNFPPGLRIGMAVYYNLAAVRRWICKGTSAESDDEE